MKTLAAWEPFGLAVTAHRKIGFVDDLAEIPDWKLYWLGGVSSLRSIGHVLHKIDGSVSELHSAIIKDFWDNSTFRNSAIFKDFIEKERNSILKHFEFGAQEYKHTLSHWGDHSKTYEQLVLENGEYVGLSFGEDEDDALRLFEIALVRWHQELATIEQAIIEKAWRPYSDGSSRLSKLQQASPITLEGLELDTPRL